MATIAAMAGLVLAPSAIGSEIVNVRSRAGRVAPSEASRGAMMLSDAFRDVAERVRPSVVQIVSFKDGSRDTPGDAAGGRDLEDVPERFRRMIPRFPDRPSPESRGPSRGQGTGVIATKDGMIITNNHVIRGADRIEVLLHDGTTLPARIVGADPETDLAVLEIERDDLAPATFADSDEARVGDWVVALGSPYGLTQTVTAGIISAMGRETVGLARFENYIQTDAAINPGNSGGPLVNLDGEVVGINTAISSRGGGNDGIGFAIPSRMVERIANDLSADGTVERGWLGVSIQPLEDPDLAASFGTTTLQGVLVSGVLENTPAREAGLEAGDIIISIDGRSTDTPATLARTVADHGPHETIILELIRDGRIMERSAKLGRRPLDPASTGTAGEPGDNATPPRLGLQLSPLDDDVREQADLRTNTGVFVEGVEAEGPASEAGIRPGDAIIRLDGREIEDLSGFQQVIGEIPEDQNVRMLIERAGETKFVLVKVRD